MLPNLRVLFLCTGSSCRSQVAEAGVDISAQPPQPVGDVLDINLDYVATVFDGARESCRLFPGKAILRHVGFEDPPLLARGASSEEETLSEYPRVRDGIRDFVETPPDRLLNEGGA